MEIITSLVLGVAFCIWLVATVLGVISVFARRIVNWEQSDLMHKGLTTWGYVMVVFSLLVISGVVLFTIGKALISLIS